MEDGIKQRVTEAIKEYEKMGAEIQEISLPYTKYGSLVYAIALPQRSCFQFNAL